MESTLGKRLKVLRVDRQMTQEEVSRYLNVQRQTYSHYENDKRVPSLDILVCLSKLYNISLQSLLCDKNTSAEEDADCILLTPLTSDEAELIHNYRTLSPAHQNDIQDYLEYKKFVSLKNAL